MSSRLDSSRAVLILLALLSAVVLGDVAQASCAMHGGAGGMGATLGRSTAVSMSSMPQGGGAQSSGAPEAARTHHHDRSEQSDSKDCSCTCIGDCSAGAPVCVLPATTTLRIAIMDAQPHRVLQARTSHAPLASVDRRLPFANGPPAARLS